MRIIRKPISYEKCVATGKTRDETEERMHEAISMDIRGVIEDGV